MLDLKDVYYFVQVVDRCGFTAAGEALRIPKSTVSHRVKELEASLGVRLKPTGCPTTRRRCAGSGATSGIRASSAISRSG